MNNSQDNGNDIDNCEESDLSVGFERTIWNYPQNSKEISQRSSQAVVVNAHPENLWYFSKVPIFHDTPYSDALTKMTEQENLLIFSESMPSRIKMYDFNKALKYGEVKYLSFPESTLKQLL